MWIAHALKKNQIAPALKKTKARCRRSGNRVSGRLLMQVFVDNSNGVAGKRIPGCNCHRSRLHDVSRALSADRVMQSSEAAKILSYHGVGRVCHRLNLCHSPRRGNTHAPNSPMKSADQHIRCVVRPPPSFFRSGRATPECVRLLTSIPAGHRCFYPVAAFRDSFFVANPNSVPSASKSNGCAVDLISNRAGFAFTSSSNGSDTRISARSRVLRI